MFLTVSIYLFSVSKRGSPTLISDNLSRSGFCFSFFPACFYKSVRACVRACEVVFKRRVKTCVQKYRWRMEGGGSFWNGNEGAHIWGSFRLLSSVCVCVGGVSEAHSQMCVYMCAISWQWGWRKKGLKKRGQKESFERGRKEGAGERRCSCRWMMVK